MNVFFLAPVLVLAGGVALVLVLWALEARRWERWFALALLVLWGILVGWGVIKVAYPQLLYSREERVYMDRLAAAIEASKTRVPLQELVPFEWEGMCFVSAPYYGIGDADVAQIQKFVGIDASAWFEDGREPTMFFKTSLEVIKVRDYSGKFYKIVRVEKVPVHKSYYVGTGYSITLQDGRADNEDSNYVFCDETGERAYVKIEKAKG